MTNELKKIEENLNQFTYSHGLDINRVFEDWLQFIIGNFSVVPQIIEDWRSRYTKEQDLFFHNLMVDWFKLMNNMVPDEKMWYDAFGNIYENLIISKGKASSLGQFFTPTPICDFMSAILSTEEEKKPLVGGLVNDPACGSGRTLLSFHVKNIGNYLVGEDIDKMSCLMTICNFLIHGVVGEVIWHDSLDPSSYFGGWKVNARLNNPWSKYRGLPHVQELSQADSKCWQMWQAKKKEVENVNVGEIIYQSGQQLKLFDF